MLGVERQGALDTHDEVDERDRDPREDDHARSRSASSSALVRARAERPVDGRSAQPRKWTRPSKTAAMYEPRYRQHSPRRRRARRRKSGSPSEPLRLEHRDAEVEEEHDAEPEQEARVQLISGPAPRRGRASQPSRRRCPRWQELVPWGPDWRSRRYVAVNPRLRRVNRTSTPRSGAARRAHPGKCRATSWLKSSRVSVVRSVSPSVKHGTISSWHPAAS